MLGIALKAAATNMAALGISSINFSKLNNTILHTKLTTTDSVIVTIYALSYNVCRMLDGYFSLVFEL